MGSVAHGIHSLDAASAVAPGANGAELSPPLQDWMLAKLAEGSAICGVPA